MSLKPWFIESICWDNFVCVCWKCFYFILYFLLKNMLFVFI